MNVPAFGQLKWNFKCVAFHILGIALPSSSCSMYAQLSRLIVTLVSRWKRLNFVYKACVNCIKLSQFMVVL